MNLGKEKKQEHGVTRCGWLDGCISGGVYSYLREQTRASTLWLQIAENRHIASTNEATIE